MGKKTTTTKAAAPTKAAPAKPAKAVKAAAPKVAEVVEDSLTVAMKKANDLIIKK